MDFRIDAVLPASAGQLWAIFFDVQRVATLIPGCENVAEIQPLQEFSAVMKQKIGPFKLEVPTRIVIESHTIERQVVLVAAGADKLTGTKLDVRMNVELQELAGTDRPECRLAVAASMQVAGRLASLGYPIVKKRSEELFGEFQRRLRTELSGFSQAAPAASLAAQAPIPNPAAPASQRASAPSAESVAVGLAAAPAQAANRAPVHAQMQSRTELVLLWPRVGVTVAVGLAVAHGAVAFGQSPWWWLAAPLLGVAAGLGGRRR